jgi:glycosyltransferase involved in cell wall biosynthesis
VVATRFPYAVEMLATGAGRVVDHDPSLLAAGIRSRHDHPGAYERAVGAAAMAGKSLSWESVARRYWNLIERHEVLVGA